MNKAELQYAVAKQLNLSKATVSKVIDTTLETIVAALRADESVNLIGFGNFNTKLRAERVGRNPRTGEVITIPSAKLPSFKPGKSLKDAVRSSEQEEEIS